MSKHPRPSTFARFGKGLASRSQNQRIVRHLLTSCPDCENRREQAAQFDYSAAFEGIGARVDRAGLDLAAERSAAPGRLRGLLARPDGLRRAAIESDSSCRTWAVCELLQDAAAAAEHRQTSLELARLGLEVATRLDGARYGQARVQDLAGRAWTVLGCAELAAADDPAAERSFSEARRRLRSGTGDPLEEARLLMAESLLLARQGRLRQAHRLLARVAATGRRLDDDSLSGKARLLQGLLAGAESLPALVLLAGLAPAWRMREGG